MEGDRTPSVGRRRHSCALFLGPKALAVLPFTTSPAPIGQSTQQALAWRDARRPGSTLRPRASSVASSRPSAPINAAYLRAGMEAWMDAEVALVCTTPSGFSSSVTELQCDSQRRTWPNGMATVVRRHPVSQYRTTYGDLHHSSSYLGSRGIIAASRAWRRCETGMPLVVARWGRAPRDASSCREAPEASMCLENSTREQTGQ